VTASVRPGGITGLIGPDGAGKTTLFRLAAGLLVADAGRVEVTGRDAARESLAVQAEVGYMPQRFGLYEDLTVSENLELYADLLGVPRSHRADRYAELGKMTGLTPFLDRLAGKLSGGMKQKLGLACTLIRRPRLLLLDEPTVGVDPVSRRELWEIVERLTSEEGVTVFLSTAYLDEAERCRDVILLFDGEVLGHETPDAFRDRVRGGTFTISAAPGSGRELAESLLREPGVADAVARGGSVRVVAPSHGVAEIVDLLPDDLDVDVERTEPRFEDAFIALLAGRGAGSGSGESDSMSPGFVRPTSGGEQESEDGPPRAGKPRRHSAAPAISVEDLERRFGDFRAVRGISFEVADGEIFGLLGPNGAGKSTTFRMLCGTLPATSGTLRVAGVDLRTAPSAARRRVGYMSQDFSLYRHLDVRQNLSFFSRAYGLRGRARVERIEGVLEEFDLARYAGTNGGDLPIGYQRRLSMACALLHRPDILFLDEPTSGVDPTTRRRFWRRIQSLAAEGVTVMVTTHFLEEAEYCDRMAILEAGEILALGTAEEIRRSAEAPEGYGGTIEDAFIRLVEERRGGNGGAR
jgi:ABC-2 type transport system ATP-binding protein